MNVNEHHRPEVVMGLLCVACFALCGVVWQLGALQSSELWVYDAFLTARAPATGTDPNIVIVWQSEDDIRHLDYPLHDDVLAQLLEKIEAAGPAVVALDLYRDLPEPRDGSRLPDLSRVFLDPANANLLAIFKAPSDGLSGVPPPKFLRDDPTRFGFNNYPYDFNAVRRSYLTFGSPPSDSLSWRVAQVYAAAHGIHPAIEDHEIRFGKGLLHRFRKNDGPYRDAFASGYQITLDFKGPRDYPSYTISDVLRAKEPLPLKGKIVLIGASAQSLNDIYHIPVVHRDLVPGVLIHALIINQLLRVAFEGDSTLVSASEPVRWFSLALACALGGVLAALVRSYVFFTASLLLGLAGILGLAWLAFNNGYWLLTVAPMLGCLSCAITVKGYAAFHEAKQRENLMHLFSQHVSPAVAEKIWEERHLFLRGGRPAAQRITVTALFSDLKNYSTISEKMTPDELMQWISECTGALAQHVGANDGYISCYMGDGMMVFGVPVAHGDEDGIRQDAINAVRCALAMAGEIRRMNERWRQEGRPSVGLRIGIFTGVAMTGMLGTHDKLEYSVIGDTINTASRLESLDKEGKLTGETGDCRILVGGSTFAYVKEKFAGQYVGKMALKGKDEEVDVYKILDQDEAAP